MKSVLLFPMRYELEILDGTNKGKRLLLRNGLILGNSQEELSFADPDMFASHAVINYSAQKSWNIECLAPSRMRLGYEEVVSASLILGLVFHLGQTGFKVVELDGDFQKKWDQAQRDGKTVAAASAWLTNQKLLTARGVTVRTKAIITSHPPAARSHPFAGRPAAGEYECRSGYGIPQ